MPCYKDPAMNRAYRLQWDAAHREDNRESVRRYRARIYAQQEAAGLRASETQWLELGARLGYLSAIVNAARKNHRARIKSQRGPPRGPSEAAKAARRERRRKWGQTHKEYLLKYQKQRHAEQQIMRAALAMSMPEAFSERDSNSPREQERRQRNHEKEVLRRPLRLAKLMANRREEWLRKQQKNPSTCKRCGRPFEVAFGRGRAQTVYCLECAPIAARENSLAWFHRKHPTARYNKHRDPEEMRKSEEERQKARENCVCQACGKRICCGQRGRMPKYCFGCRADQQKQNAANWQSKNKDRVRALSRQHYLEHSDEYKARARKWLADHPGYKLQWDRNHRKQLKKSKLLRGGIGLEREGTAPRDASNNVQ